MKDIKNLKITYIGGGSRGWARTLMNDLANDSEIGGSVYLYDLDFDAAQNNEKIGNMLSAREDVVGKWKYKAVKTLKEALINSDFVIISILPGTFDEMESDVHLPEKYGIYQSVGDTVGPGGIVRALRTIPCYVEFANAIKEYCPKAWVINFTKPYDDVRKGVIQSLSRNQGIWLLPRSFRHAKNACRNVQGKTRRRDRQARR